MKRHHGLNDYTFNTQHELFRRVAFHEAGHAVAIYLHNKQQQLPPVAFQIAINAHQGSEIKPSYLAKVEGGRLINNLPLSLAELSDADQQAYLHVFETDIINLLAGPLAEAKYVAKRDDEAINRYLVNLSALGAYGGATDLELVNDYIHCFIENSQQRNAKIEQLFIAAFKFIDVPQHWTVINVLATHIIHATSPVIPYSEVITVIEHAL